MDVLGLAQDLCARICHDLGGPLGALSGALELAEAEPVEALSVARDSAEAMRGRLRLWRAVAGGGTGPLDRQGIAELLAGTLANGRVTADLSDLPDAPLPASLTQALLAGAMLGSEALPRGGIIHLAGDETGLAIWPEGRNAAWPAALTAMLAGEAVAGPRDVLAPLLLQLAGEAGMALALALGREGTVPPLALHPRG
ncbi:histidine phosphotransferase family protein [Roseomonas xinghualingensis]|uniref:histidine phosphotransferase family protein n=1 Tax=Roseomonas xinghualingensis TaxID=2986475 RepID=UPI0021F1CD09|nr:histidine phosphotransferase family protein [Roseomonas sp. SXEYE001]MCV4207681.1 histidine phosphotransferase family protein [Roseomonas sp. SXEYE001]